MRPTVLDLIDKYRRYDLYVDIVSVFESLFTRAADFAATVRHFERFPTVTGADGQKARPDFTVVFNDGTGLAGEIASVAPQPESLDKTCRQIGRYDQLTELPVNSSGACEPVSHVDVLFLTPHEHSLNAASRILDAAADPNHPYEPTSHPLVASFVLSSNSIPSRYVIQRVPLDHNGTLRERDRSVAVGKRLASQTILASVGLFEAVKVERVFMNDPIDPLYLATHLWTRIFPELSSTHATSPNAIHVTEDQLADELKTRYGRGAPRDIRTALNHLAQARLCGQDADGRWTVAWQQLRRRRTDHDTAKQIAERIVKPPEKGSFQRLKETHLAEPPLRLFDLRLGRDNSEARKDRRT